METEARNKLENQIHEIEKEFPDDPALQQIHIARKIISQEAEQRGLSYFEFLQTQRQKSKNQKQERL